MKQLAAVLLRQYVDIHWCEDAEKFTLPEAPSHVRIWVHLWVISKASVQTFNGTNFYIATATIYIFISEKIDI